MTSEEVWPAGVMTALVTPFKGDEVDVAAVETLVERQVRAGAAALVVAGGTGEFRALAIEERKRLAEEVVRAAAGRLRVIVQTGAEATRGVLELSRHAAGVGADGLLVASPFGEPLTWREKHAFYEQVNAVSEVPIMIYNTLPAGILTLEQLTSLAELDKVSAIKESSYDMLVLGDVLAWAVETNQVDVYVGADSLTLDAVRAGAVGTLTGISNFIGPELATLVELARRGEEGAANARALWPSIRALSRFMETTSNYVALVKLGCAQRGLEVGPVRGPYLMPTDDEAGAFSKLLAAVDEAFAALPEDMTVINGQVPHSHRQPA